MPHQMKKMPPPLRMRAKFQRRETTCCKTLGGSIKVIVQRLDAIDARVRNDPLDDLR